MNTETLRQIFKLPFDYTTYSNEIVHRLFACNDVATRPELLDTNTEGDQSFFIGQMDDTDHRLLGFFYTRMADGSDVRRKRVGLHKLISPYLKYDVDGAIAVFDDGRHWRLSYICDLKEGSTSAKRFSYILGDENGQYKTPLERLEKVAKLNGCLKLADLKESFSVDALSDEFFDEYHLHYDRIVVELARQGKTGSIHHDYVKKMMGRIVFLHFLQKKGWLNGNSTFLRDLFLSSPHQADFLEQVLEPLFFGIFNTEPEQREKLFANEHWDKSLLKQWEHLPYLNGGLFERDEVDKMNIKLPASLFDNLFSFLASYNFTVDENDPDDAEIGVDPEMLGKIFESLLEDNKAKGAFYTPKEIVRYMCKESLIAYLTQQLADCRDARPCVSTDPAIRAFVETHEFPSELEPYRNVLYSALREVKICDPAIGSGAFPMGLLNELWRCREAISTSPVVEMCHGASQPMDASSLIQFRAALKREIIENNIYGVDIERGAIDIARLRFWLSIVVDSDEPEALPNFDYKFMQGNSLVESYAGFDLSRIAGKTVGRPSTSSQYVIGLDSDLIRKNLQKLLHKYFSVNEHQQKANMRHSINAEVKTLICESFGGTPTFLARLEQLDPSANQVFFLWHTWLKDIFDNGGFDIIIANPPYVKEYTNRAAFDGFRETSPYYMGKMDLWYGFACHGLDMLKKDGILCFIAQNNWTTSAGAKKMREKVIKDSQIIQMLDFNTYMVFENADIQTMIILFKRNSKIDDYQFDYRIITNGTDKNDMLALLSKKHGNTKYNMPIINRKKYCDGLLTFSDNESLFDKIADGKTYLKDDEIAQGIVPNPDVVNSRNKKTLSDQSIQVGEGVFVVDKDKFTDGSESEKKYIKPLYEPYQMQRYCITQKNDKCLLYITKANWKNDAPRLLSHLSRYKEIMQQRRENQNGRIDFMHLHWPRDERFFTEGVKILSVRKCVGSPIFVYYEPQAYVMMAVNVIKTPRWNMKFLTGVLNSTLVAYWLRSKGKMQGSNYQVDKEPLQGIPLPIVDVSQQKPIITLVDQILSIKTSNSRADTSTIEHKIDELVYDLYGLTEEEITVIEGA